MNINDCNQCSQKENKTEGGNCKKKNGMDNFPIMCVGDWAKEKHYYLNNYFRIFTVGMKGKWRGGLCYVDLFSGPGICRDRKTNEEINGSPLISLQYNFDKYIFVESDAESYSALTERVKEYKNKNICLLNKNCNDCIPEIVNEIPKGSLVVAFIDPFGLDFDFKNYIDLTKDKNIDLIINFPMGMAIKRNMKSNKLDHFIGSEDWKSKIMISFKQQATKIIQSFKENLDELGYLVSENTYIMGDIVVRNSLNAPMYYLIFASKNKKGFEFWNKITKYNPSGQVSLFAK